METVTRDGPTPQPSGTAEHRSRDTVGRLAGLVAAAGAVAYVGLADPGSRTHPYPACPSRLLLGLDCPACGGLRGTHDLLHGDVVGALDHNLLLPLLLGLYAFAAVVAFAPLVGRTIGPVHPPRWLLVAGAALLAAFMVMRNLPIAGLEFLDSGTS